MVSKINKERKKLHFEISAKKLNFTLQDVSDSRTQDTVYLFETVWQILYKAHFKNRS